MSSWYALTVLVMVAGCTSTSTNQDTGSGGADAGAGSAGVAGYAGSGGGAGSGGLAGSGGVAGGGGVAGSGGSGGCQCSPPHAVGNCVDGGCVVLGCLDGYLDCNGDPTDGCEVDPETNVGNCGKCGTTCTVATHGSPICVDGVCKAQCDAGFLECDGDPANGCESSIVVFEDTDEDTYGIASVWKEACAASPGWAVKIGDCDDQDALVHPGQGNFYSAPNPKVGFDYNCDGTVTKALTELGYCSSICKLGWASSSVPNCGVSGNYVAGCCSGSCTPCSGYSVFTQICH